MNRPFMKQSPNLAVRTQTTVDVNIESKNFRAEVAGSSHLAVAHGLLTCACHCHSCSRLITY